MPVVDLRTHFFPRIGPSLAERFGTPDWPWIRRDSADHAMVMMGNQSSRPSPRPAGTPPCGWPTWTATVSTSRSSRPPRSCSPTAARPSTPWSAPASSTTRLLELCAGGGGRLVPLGQVPLQDTDLACRELGTLHGRRHEGRPDRQPRRPRDSTTPGLVNFLAHCDSLARGVRAPVGHVRAVAGWRTGCSAWTAGAMPAETQLSLNRMILGGAFDRLPARPAHLLRRRRRTDFSRSCSAGWRTRGTVGTRAWSVERADPAPTSTASRSTRPSTTPGALRYVVDVMGRVGAARWDFPVPARREHGARPCGPCASRTTSKGSCSAATPSTSSISAPLPLGPSGLVDG